MKPRTIQFQGQKVSLTKHPAKDSMIQQHLESLYNKSPHQSNFKVKTDMVDNRFYQVEISIATLYDQFSYKGIHNCLVDAFDAGVNSIKEQIQTWHHTRFQH